MFKTIRVNVLPLQNPVPFLAGEWPSVWSVRVRPLPPFGILQDTLHVPIRNTVHIVNKGFIGNPTLDFILAPSELY